MRDKKGKKGEIVFSPQYFTKQKHYGPCRNPKKSSRINLASSTLVYYSEGRRHELVRRLGGVSQELAVLAIKEIQ